MTPDEALALHIKDNDEVFVLTKSYGRALIYADVVVRVHRNYHLAMHVDTDEANAFNSDTEPYEAYTRSDSTATKPVSAVTLKTAKSEARKPV